MPLGLLAITGCMVLLVGLASSTYLVFSIVVAIALWRPAASLALTAVAVGWASYLLPRLLGEPPVVELVVIIVVVAALIYVLRHLQRQQAVTRRAREDMAQLAVDAERARFSRDLHDIVGHSLTGIIVKAELAAALAKRRPGTGRSRSRASWRRPVQCSTPRGSWRTCRPRSTRCRASCVSCSAGWSARG